VKSVFLVIILVAVKHVFLKKQYQLTVRQIGSHLDTRVNRTDLTVILWKDYRYKVIILIRIERLTKTRDGN
jgi:hypothetical protein